MPLQVGTMMVVVRAQDFASRTLRRVGTELEGLSRAEAMRMRGDMVQQQMRMAKSAVASAEANMQALRTVDMYRQAMERQASVARQLTQAQTQLDRMRSARPAAIRAAQQEIAMARQELDFFRRIREVAGRKVVSPAERVRGMEQASQRLKRAHDQLARAARSLPGGQAIADLEKRVSSLSSAYSTAGKAVNRYGEQVRNLPGWLRSAATSQFAFDSATRRANDALSTAYSNLSRAQQAQLAFNRAVAAMPVQRMAQLGHALSGIGRTMQLIGLIGTGVLAATANSFANFNQQVMLAATQTGSTESTWVQITNRASELEDAILDLTQAFPASANDMAAAAYDIYSSMNVSFGGGIDLLKRFNQLSVATMTDLQTATNAGITVLNNFGGTSADINKTLNLMVATVRFGRMRLEDFNTMLNKIAPAAASAGNSLADVAGAMALITTRQPSQRQAATGIARLFQVFQDPDFQEGVRRASRGMVDIVKEGGGLKPLPIIVNDLADAFKQVATQKGAAQLFRELTATGRGAGRGLRSTIEAQRAWTFLFKNLKDYNDLQDKVTGDNKEFARSLKAMSESPGVRWQVFLNQMRALVLVVGEAAIPVFLKIGDTISNVVQWFRDLEGGTRDLIIRWGTWAAVGSLVAGVLLGIAGPILAAIAHFKMWRMGVAGTEARILTLSAALRAIPLAGITAIVAQFVGWERAIRIMILGWAAWKAAGITAAAAVAIANRVAATSVKVAWRAALASTGIGLLALAMGLAAEYIITHWEKVKGWFQRFWDWLRLTAYETADAVLSAFSWLPGKLGNWATQARKGLQLEMGKIKMSQFMRQEAMESAREMDQFLKNQPKKFRAYRKALMKEISGTKPGSMLRESLRQELQLYNQALKRRNKMKADADSDLFSKDFWKTFGAKNAEDFSKALEDMYNTQIEGASEAADWQRQLTQTQEDAANQAVDNLRNMYIEMQGVNEQMMGQLFQGPWLTSETFDLAKEWGITPRIQDIIKDLDGQIAQFKQRRDMIDKLFKRGLPQGFLNELKQMTPEEAMPILRELVNATPKETQKLIGRLNSREKLIKDATMIDFTREITAFRKAGLNMGDALINGFKNAEVGKWFDNWIKATFPQLINAAVAQAVAQWKKENPRPATPTAPGGAKPNGAAPKSGGTKGGDDNSKTITVSMTIPPGTPPDHEARARRAAFMAANAVKGSV